MWLASGLVRLPLAVRLPIEPLLLANRVEAWFVSLDRTGSYSRSYSYFSLAPVPALFPFSFIDAFVVIGIS